MSELFTSLAGELLVNILLLLLVALFALINFLLIEKRKELSAWLTAHVGERQAYILDGVLNTAVRAAQDRKEQLLVEGGEQALLYAIRFASKEAERRGVDLGEADLEDLLRARYQEIKPWLAATILPAVKVPPQVESDA